MDSKSGVDMEVVGVLRLVDFVGWGSGGYVKLGGQRKCLRRIYDYVVWEMLIG